MDDSAFVRVNRRFTETGTFISIEGELDAAVSAQLRRALVTAIVSGGLVEVDLDGVTFADSSAISALLDATLFAEQYRVELRIVSVTPVVRRLLVIAGVPDLLPDEVPNAG